MVYETPIHIVAARRSPIGRFDGGLKKFTAPELASHTAEATVPEALRLHIVQVILGQILQAGSGMNTARQVGLRLGIPQATPAFTVNMVCGSGLKAVALGAGNIDESAIVRLSDGRLFMVCRLDGGRFFSKDRGKTWRYGGRLVTQGKFKAPRVFALKDGTIVIVATYRNLQVWLGQNNGRDWTGPFPLDPKCYGYPGGTKLPDDSLLISYCSSGRAPNRIYCVRFRVNEKRNGIELLLLGGKRGQNKLGM